MANRLANSLKDDYLRCRICLGQYQNPRNLSCDHSFCEQCLVNHVTQSATRRQSRLVISCPLCRQEVTTANAVGFDARKWVSGLPEDALICSLLQTIELHEGDFARRVGTTTKVCSVHHGRIRDAYCFTHAQLICWECAARDHRACNVDSAAKAISAVQTNLVALKTEVNQELSKARLLCKADQNFNESKVKALNDISGFEKRLDAMYSSAKRQIAIMRSEVDSYNRTHIDRRQVFYDQVSVLLELSFITENFREQDPVSALAELEAMNKDLVEVKHALQASDDSNGIDSVSGIKFVADRSTLEFLKSYSSVGFVDTDSGCSMSGLQDGRGHPGAPTSISHILNRGNATERSLNDV